jgi:hypothetical protein
MTSDVQHAETHAPDEGVSFGTIAFGLILLALGLLWILDLTDIVGITWTVVGSVILIVLGLTLIAAARQGTHGGMIFLGLVLSAIVLLGSVASWPAFEGGVGDRTIAPSTFSEVEQEYSWAVGNQELDLRGIAFPVEETAISVQMGTGNLEIQLPEDVAYRVHYSVGLGNAQVLDRSQTGAGLDGTLESGDFDDAERRIVLNISLGLGSLEVSQ